METILYTLINVDERATIWSRVKLVWSLLLTPLTILLIGRSIRVRVEDRSVNQLVSGELVNQ